MALQYAKAMGMKVIAVTTHPEKGKLALELGADLVVDAHKDPAAEVQKAVGGVHGVLVTAVSKYARSGLRHGSLEEHHSDGWNSAGRFFPAGV